MKRFNLWKLAVLCGALTMFGCPSNTEAPAAEGSGAADEAAPAADEAAPAAEEAAGDEAAADEAAPAAEEAAATQPAAEAGEAAPAGEAIDYVATNDSLMGTWDADMQATLAGLPENERQMAMVVLGSAQMQLTFSADGTMNMSMTMMGEEKSEGGTFSVVSTEANVVTLSTTTETEGEATTETMTATFSDANTVALRSADDPQAFIFKRRI